MHQDHAQPPPVPHRDGRWEDVLASLGQLVAAAEHLADTANILHEQLHRWIAPEGQRRADLHRPNPPDPHFADPEANADLDAIADQEEPPEAALLPPLQARERSRSPPRENQQPEPEDFQPEQPDHAREVVLGQDSADEDDSEPELWEPPFVIATAARPRRDYRIGYLDMQASIGDLHHEYSRLARRGAWTFCLCQHDERIDGRTLLRELRQRHDIVAWPHNEDHERPLSARRPPLPPAHHRGGSPSSVRSKIGKKLKRARVPPPEPLQLLQTLWPLEAQTLTQMQGEPDALAAQIGQLARKHSCVFLAGSWQFQGATRPQPSVVASVSTMAPPDPWLLSDPWASAMSSHIANPSEKSAPTRVQSVALDADDSESASQFEKADLVSKCLARDELLHLRRRPLC